MAEQTLNVPQLVVFILAAVLAIRWYMAKPSSARPAAAQQPGRPSINPAQVEQLAQMFPQFDRRQIAWDLERNRGNMAATTERVLSGRGLETPPPTFNPPLPQPTPAARNTAPAAKPARPDLITRYNLSDKLNAAPEAATENGQQKQKAWSQDKNERQAMLRKKREDMILNARRKLEAKEKAKATGASL